MMTFKVTEENDDRVLAYLYYDREKDIYHMRVPDDVEERDMPFLLHELYKKDGSREFDDYWSRKFVQNRVPPPSRQNIGQILRAAGLKWYNEIDLMQITDGRCPQDNYLVTLVETTDE